MKKLFALVAFCVVSVIAFAQREVGTFSLQPRIGMNVGTLSGLASNVIRDNRGNTYRGETTYSIGIAAGVEAEYQFSTKLSVAAGLLYSMQGTKYDDIATSGATHHLGMKDWKIQLGYLNVPVIANLYLAKGCALKAGVQLGFLVNDRVKVIAYEPDEFEEKFDESYNDFYKSEIEAGRMSNISKFDLSIPLGISYEFDNHLVIDARYNLGLTKVTDEKYANKKSKNQVIQVTVGYKFEL